MNNLFQIREKINKAKRLKHSKLLETKNGNVTPFRVSVFEERIRQEQKEIERIES